MEDAAAPLRRNRDFTLLLAGQVVSRLGNRISGIGLSLLVLTTTGSAAKTGIVGFAATIPLLVLSLHAGALADRWDRKALMIATDSVRALALFSIVAAIAFDVLTFAQIIVVALIEGIGLVLFGVGERAALRYVVRDDQLQAAMARNQSRDYVALLAGQPLGGILFGLGRLVPFLFDAVSYVLSVVTLSAIRSKFQAERGTSPPSRLGADVREGLVWTWRQPFMRTTLFISAGASLTINALSLVVLVLARQRGASPALIGVMFAFVGGGGLIGALIAPWLARRLQARHVVVIAVWLMTALLPLLVVAPGAVTPGVVYGAMFVVLPAWNATIGAQQLRLTPDALQGRVQGVVSLVAVGFVPFALVLTGFLIEAAGTTWTVVAFVVLMLAASTVATASGSIRSAAQPTPT